MSLSRSRAHQASAHRSAMFVAVAACALMLTSTAWSQSTSRGPVLGLGMAYIPGPNSRSASGPVDPRLLYSKKPGFMPGTTLPARSGRPSFTFRALFNDRTLFRRIPQIQIDALSLGQDDLLADSSGMVDVSTCPNSCWGAVLFTVGRDSLPTRGTTGVVLAEEGLPGGAAADVFSYVLADAGSGVARTVLGQTERALDSSELGLAGASGSHVSDLWAMDLAIPHYELDAGFRAQLDPNPVVYFSVSTATVPMVPNNWWRDSLGAVRQPSGAAILFTRWNGATWSRPRVFLGARDLSLSNERDDIDALAVEASKGQLVYSLTSGSTTPQASQLMFFDWLADSNPAAYCDGSGQPIAEEAGGGRVVVGVCVGDPGYTQGGRSHTYAWGTPIDPGALAIFPRTIEAATYRTCLGPAPGIVSLATNPPTGAAMFFVVSTDNPTRGGYVFPGSRPLAVFTPVSGTPAYRAEFTFPGLATLNGRYLVGAWVGLTATQVNISLPMVVNR